MGCLGECLLSHCFSLYTAGLCSFPEYLPCAWLLLGVCLGVELGGRGGGGEGGGGDTILARG